VLAAQADLARFEGDLPRAHRLVAEAEAAGLAAPQLLLLKSTVADDIRERITALSKVLELDPGNLDLAAQLWFALVGVRKPVEAVRVLDEAKARTPQAAPFADTLRAVTVFSFTGNLELLAPYSKREIVFDNDAQSDPDDALRIVFERMILRGQFSAARDLLDEFGRDSIRGPLIGPFYNGGIGRQPIADFRGWADLLLGDLDAAREDGRKLLAFVENTPATRWSGWYLAALRADALLFMGNPDDAAKTAGAMLELATKGDSARTGAAELLGARALAWAGKQDAAVDLLTRLATDVPGSSPAEIARQPLYTTPLRDNARFAALVQRLEAEMAATDLH
jgi:hypothetical protein